MKISKGTIVRTILMLVVIANIVLQQMGHDIIDVDESTILTLVELLIEVAVLIVAWWKNNSFSDKAIAADKFLQELRNSDEEIEEVE